MTWFKSLPTTDAVDASPSRWSGIVDSNRRSKRFELNREIRGPEVSIFAPGFFTARGCSKSAVQRLRVCKRSHGDFKEQRPARVLESPSGAADFFAVNRPSRPRFAERSCSVNKVDDSLNRVERIKERCRVRVHLVSETLHALRHAIGLVERSNMVTALRYLLIFLISSFALEARANCARGAGYDVDVEGNSVRICPWVRECSRPGGMLRQNSVTGEVVRLADGCNGESECYLDECVPPGSYRYGFAEPYDCSLHGCGHSVAYWQPAVVSSELNTCVRSPDNAEPTAYPAGAPWPNEQNRECFGCGCSETGTSVVVIQIVFGLGALAWMVRRKRT